MKKIIFITIISCLQVLVFAQTKVGEVSFLLGEVEYSPGDTTAWFRLGFDSDINEDWELRIGNDSQLEITWSEGAKITLSEQGTVKVSEIKGTSNKEENKSISLFERLRKTDNTGIVYNPRPKLDTLNAFYVSLTEQFLKSDYDSTSVRAVLRDYVDYLIMDSTFNITAQFIFGERFRDAQRVYFADKNGQAYMLFGCMQLDDKSMFENFREFILVNQILSFAELRNSEEITPENNLPFVYFIKKFPDTGLAATITVLTD